MSPGHRVITDHVNSMQFIRSMIKSHILPPIGHAWYIDYPLPNVPRWINGMHLYHHHHPKSHIFCFAAAYRTRCQFTFRANSPSIKCRNQKICQENLAAMRKLVLNSLFSFIDRFNQSSLRFVCHWKKRTLSTLPASPRHRPTLSNDSISNYKSSCVRININQAIIWMARNSWC